MGRDFKENERFDEGRFSLIAKSKLDTIKKTIIKHKFDTSDGEYELKRKGQNWINAEADPNKIFFHGLLDISQIPKKEYFYDKKGNRVLLMYVKMQRDGFCYVNNYKRRVGKLQLSKGSLGQPMDRRFAGHLKVDWIPEITPLDEIPVTATFYVHVPDNSHFDAFINMGYNFQVGGTPILALQDSEKRRQLIEKAKGGMPDKSKDFKPPFLDIRTLRKTTGALETRHLKFQPKIIDILKTYYDLSEKDVRFAMSRGYRKITPQSTVSKYWKDQMADYKCLLILIDSLSILLCVDEYWEVIYKVRKVRTQK